MHRLALFAVLFALASVALPPAQARSVSGIYVVAGGDVSHACVAVAPGIGATGVCLTWPDANVFDFDIHVNDDTGQRVSASYEVTHDGSTVIESGHFCDTVHVHTNFVNNVAVRVFPSARTTPLVCGPATSGDVIVSW